MGKKFRNSQSGCVHIWKRLIKVTPYATSGITATALKI